MIQVNGNSLEAHLDLEKSKEIKVEFHASISKHALYRRSNSRAGTRGRSHKAKVISSKEEIFMHFLDRLPEDISLSFIDAHSFKQGRVWRAWRKTNITSVDDAVSQLESLIKQIV